MRRNTLTQHTATRHTSHVTLRRGEVTLPLLPLLPLLRRATLLQHSLRYCVTALLRRNREGQAAAPPLLRRKTVPRNPRKTRNTDITAAQQSLGYCGNNSANSGNNSANNSADHAAHQARE